MQGDHESRGQGHTSVTSQNKTPSEGTGLCPDSATPIGVTLGEFPTLPTLPSNTKEQTLLHLSTFWWTCLVARKGNYSELA